MRDRSPLGPVGVAFDQSAPAAQRVAGVATRRLLHQVVELLGAPDGLHASHDVVEVLAARPGPRAT